MLSRFATRASSLSSRRNLFNNIKKPQEVEKEHIIKLFEEYDKYHYNGFPILRVSLGIVGGIIIVGSGWFIFRDPLHEMITEEGGQLAGKTLTHAEVQKQTEELSRRVTTTLSKDPEVLKTTIEFLIDIVQSDESFVELNKLLMSVIQDKDFFNTTQKESTKLIINLLNDPYIKNEVTKLLMYSVTQILNDKAFQDNLQEKLTKITENILVDPKIIDLATQSTKTIIYNVINPFSSLEEHKLDPIEIKKELSEKEMLTEALLLASRLEYQGRN